MDQNINSALTGLMEGINGYLKLGNEIGVKKLFADQEYEQKKNLVTYEKTLEAALRKPTATISYGALKKLNPKLEALGLPNDTAIPLDSLSEFSGILPKDHDWGTSGNPYLTLPEAASHLYMLGVPDSKISEITDHFQKNKTNKVLKSVIDDAAKAYGARPQDTETRLRIFAGSVDPTDPEFMTKFRDWNSKIDAYTRPQSNSTTKLDLPDTQLDQVAAKASEVYQGYTKNGMNPAEALSKTTDQLGEVYNGASVSKVLNKIDHTQTPRPKEPMPGFRQIVSKLLGQ